MKRLGRLIREYWDDALLVLVAIALAWAANALLNDLLTSSDFPW